MIENRLSFFFKHQIWHIGGLIVLYYAALQMVDFETDSNVFLGISSKNWFLFSMITPLLHQGYVWLCWRSELCWKTISRTIGFKGYVLIFFIVAILRFLCVGLCFADYGTWFTPGWIAWSISILIFIPFVYTMYSVKKNILDSCEQLESITLTQVTKINLLKKEVFLNGPLTQCTLLPSPYFLALLFPQDQKQCLYLLLILILVCGYIISAQRKKILKLYTEIINLP